MKNADMAKKRKDSKHIIKNFRKEGFDMKKVISLVLSLVTVLTMFVFPVSASAASTGRANWPSLSEYSYAEFYATKAIPVYRDSACTIRGSSNPAQSYNAEIWNGDTCRIIEATWNYLKVKYPASGTMRTGYIRRSDLFTIPSPSGYWPSSKASVVVYADTNGTYYGKTAIGDEFYDLGSPSYGSNYTWIMYTAVSGSRHWKVGLVKISDFNRMIGA